MSVTNVTVPRRYGNVTVTAIVTETVIETETIIGYVVSMG